MHQEMFETGQNGEETESQENFNNNQNKGINMSRSRLTMDCRNDKNETEKKVWEMIRRGNELQDKREKRNKDWK